MKITDMYNAAAKDLKQAARQGRPFAAFLSSEVQIQKAQNLDINGKLTKFRKPRPVGVKSGTLYGIVTFENKENAGRFTRTMAGTVDTPSAFIETAPKQTNKKIKNMPKAIYAWGVPAR